MPLFQRKKSSPQAPILRHLESAISVASGISESSNHHTPQELIRSISDRLDPSASDKWEKRMTKRIKKFREDHPLLVNLISALMVSAGAGAASIPAILAALGIKLAVVGAGTGAIVGTTKLVALSGATVATTGASSGLIAIGSKTFIGTFVMNVGGRIISAAMPAVKEKEHASLALVAGSSRAPISQWRSGSS